MWSRLVSGVLSYIQNIWLANPDLTAALRQQAHQSIYRDTLSDLRLASPRVPDRVNAWMTFGMAAGLRG